MADEILNNYSINYSAIQPIVDLFDGKPDGSIMVASDHCAHELSGKFTYAEPKNAKIITHSDGVSPAYLKTVLDGIGEGLIVFRKATDSRIDMGVFRPKESELSGTFYANDPAALSADGSSWHFIQGQHADPNGSRYQLSSMVYDNLATVERDRVYGPNEISNVGLDYFRGECEKNGKYIDQMISRGKIKCVDKKRQSNICGTT